MQILHLGTIILTSISSTPPLAGPPVNKNCQITYVDLWDRGGWAPLNGLLQSQQKIIVFESNPASFML